MCGICCEYKLLSRMRKNGCAETIKTLETKEESARERQGNTIIMKILRVHLYFTFYFEIHLNLMSLHGNVKQAVPGIMRSFPFSRCRGGDIVVTTSWIVVTTI